MQTDRERFTCVLLCEDVRYEIGKKRTLVGVFSGDVLVSQFPAHLRIAFYFEFQRPRTEVAQDLRFTIWLDDKEVGKGLASVEGESPTAGIDLPQAIMRVNGESQIRLTVSVDGRDEFELLKKRIYVGQVEPR